MPRVDPFGVIRHMDDGLHLFQLFNWNMTFDDVPIRHNLLRRRIIITNIADFPMAAGAKRAALGRIHGAGQVSLQYDLTLGHFRIGYRHRR